MAFANEAFEVRQASNGVIAMTFRGPLDVAAVPALWQRALEHAGQATSELVLDLTDVTTCDGAGVGLLVEIDRIARASGTEVRVDGVSEELGELLRMARLPAHLPPVPERPGFVGQVGSATAGLLATVRDLIDFVGSLTAALFVGFATLRPARVAEIVRNCTRVGADAVPVVSLLGALVGIILAVQASRALEKVGATSLIPMVVGFATLREFGPLIAGIILAGRSGSAFAAELGTMKVTEELDAYTTFALDPMVFLVFPRVVASVIVMPLLALFAITFGVAAGVLPMLARGYTFAEYLDAVVESVVLVDLVQALVKAAVFGLIIAGLGCFHGLRTGRGADAVGASATRAVVAGIVAILIADTILSAIFYNLGF